MENNKSKVMASVDMLLDYKRGRFTWDEAITRFSYITGLTPDIAKEFIRGMKRENIIKFPTKNIRKSRGGRKSP